SVSSPTIRISDHSAKTATTSHPPRICLKLEWIRSLELGLTSKSRTTSVSEYLKQRRSPFRALVNEVMSKIHFLEQVENSHSSAVGCRRSNGGTLSPESATAPR